MAKKNKKKEHATKQKLPQQIYVFLEDDGVETYYVADDKIKNLVPLNETKIIGVYELVRTVKAVNSTTTD